jgi:cellulose synthase/poly-beta-1,6-N-acetylglucosamine synthase-like glycosyltransferase
MIGFLIGFSLLIFFVNVYYLLWVYQGLKKVEGSVSTQNSTDNSFSIIVAAHNEAEHIYKCLESLIKQNYPKTKFEIIVIADRCTDNTVQIAYQFKDEFPHLKIVEINNAPSGLSSKKYALKYGIDEASFDHFILLDADVLPTRNHLKILNQYFSENTQVVVGIMKLTLQDSFWQNFLRYERLFNWAVSA